MATEIKTFKEAYGVLQRHAESLRQQAEPNIDNLLSIVEESVSAYKVCKERIDAVEKALRAALTDVGTDGALDGDSCADEGDSGPSEARPARARPAQHRPSTGFDDMDDDIPF